MRPLLVHLRYRLILFLLPNLTNILTVYSQFSLPWQGVEVIEFHFRHEKSLFLVFLQWISDIFLVYFRSHSKAFPVKTHLSNPNFLSYLIPEPFLILPLANFTTLTGSSFFLFFCSCCLLNHLSSSSMTAFRSISGLKIVTGFAASFAASTKGNSEDLKTDWRTYRYLEKVQAIWISQKQVSSFLKTSMSH